LKVLQLASKEHACFPIHAAATTAIEWLELQVREAEKAELQLPLGVPKDAKSTLDTTSPAGQPGAASELSGPDGQTS
jgi:hypothetical protein